jgi:hypothetical protein
MHPAAHGGIVPALPLPSARQRSPALRTFGRLVTSAVAAAVVAPGQLVDGNTVTGNGTSTARCTDLPYPSWYYWTV